MHSTRFEIEPDKPRMEIEPDALHEAGDNILPPGVAEKTNL